MSIASEITRIQGAKADLKTSINAKTDAQHQITTETIDEYADFVDSISTGSGKPEQSKTTNPSTSQVVVTPDTGYTLSSVTVNAMPIGALSAPTINTSTGLITTSVRSSGYISSGTATTLQLSTQSSQTITPTTTNQTISSGKYLIGTQTISGDANLVAGNIKKDVTIFGVTGTHEGGGSATLITKSITQNGTYNASSDNADGYSQVTVNVEGGGSVEPEEKDVNYYDYDGTRLYSYTKDEFLALQAEPETPNRQEMKNCKWNVSFADSQVLVNRDGFLDIGLIGEPADCDIKMFVNLSEEFKSPYIYVGASKDCIVDWGDGTTETVTTSATSSAGWINPNHNYSKGGKYVIKITLNTTATTSSNRLYLMASSQTNPYNDSKKTGSLLWGGSSADTSKNNMIYAGCIEEIWLGRRVTKGTATEAAFSGFTNLKCILNGSTSNAIFHGESIFYNCRNLKAVCFYLQTNNISSYCFKNCYSLKRILGTNLNFSYDDGRGYVSSGKAENVFENCYSLMKNPTFVPGYPLLDTKVDYRSTAYLYKGCYSINYLYVTPCSSLSNTCFSDDYPHIKIFDFTSFGSLTNPTVPTLNSTTTFSSGTSDYEIWVPSSLYNDWIAASNWSNIASHIIAK